MSDGALIWFDFGADIQIENGDIVPDNGLANAVLISLFTDARAPDIIGLPPGETSLRGWWGQLAQRVIGSLLWLIMREKTTQEVAIRAKEFCDTALAWMVEEGVAAEVTVVPLIVKPSALQLTISITRGDSKQYAYLWDQVKNYVETTVQGTSIKLQFIE